MWRWIAVWGACAWLGACGGKARQIGELAPDAASGGASNAAGGAGSAGSAGLASEVCFSVSPQIAGGELVQRAALELGITLPAVTSDDPHDRARQLVDGVESALRGAESSASVSGALLSNFVRRRLTTNLSTGAQQPFPADLNADVQVALDTESQVVMARWISEQRSTLNALLTDDTVFLNRTLASHYGITHSFTEEWESVPQPTSERAGVLTWGGFLARFPSAPLRAMQLVQSLTCSAVPAPPPVQVSLWDDPNHPPAKDIVLANYGDAASPTCKACHQIYVGYGIALDRYDAVGRYRTTLNGKPIDTSYSLTSGYESAALQIDFANPQELGQALSKSRAVRSCLVRKFAESLGAREMTQPELDCVLTKFDANQGSFWGLFADLAPIYLGD